MGTKGEFQAAAPLLIGGAMRHFGCLPYNLQSTPLTAATRSPPAPRSAFRRFVGLSPRWKDLDALGHVNNAEIYGYFDTAIVRLLLEASAFDLQDSAFMPMLAESGARFHAEVRFADLLEVGITVETVGTSSVRYRVGLFRADSDPAVSDGFFVHVFVDRKTRRPAPIQRHLRVALESLQ